jgi:hypothetical protein
MIILFLDVTQRKHEAAPTAVKEICGIRKRPLRKTAKKTLIVT